MEKLTQQIEALLFWKQEPMTKKSIAAFLEVKNQEELTEALEVLVTKYQSEYSGIRLVQSENEYVFATDTCIADKIKSEEKEEENRDLSKAALETLAIILYRGPLMRSEIDYIRGVNSQFIIRNLLSRGLIEKNKKKDNDSIFVYSASVDLLRHLGISEQKDITDFEKVNADITSFLESSEEEDTFDDTAKQGNIESHEGSTEEDSEQI